MGAPPQAVLNLLFNVPLMADSYVRLDDHRNPWLLALVPERNPGPLPEGFLKKRDPNVIWIMAPFYTLNIFDHQAVLKFWSPKLISHQHVPFFFTHQNLKITIFRVASCSSTKKKTPLLKKRGPVRSLTLCTFEVLSITFLIFLWTCQRLLQETSSINSSETTNVGA